MEFGTGDSTFRRNIMRRCANRWGWNLVRSGWTALLIGAVLSGCSHKEESAAAPPAKASAPEVRPETSQPAETTKAADPRWHQSFADATVADPPPDQRPPDRTMTGKSVGKLYTQVVGIWDSIRFATPSGQPIHYRAVLDTEEGEIEITLRPELAPNHVRSFVALSRVGFYDGLVFERTVHEEIEGQPGSRIELIEGGCPLGTGEVGQGSIGYWLKPEFDSQAVHEEGTVGACHGERPDTAAGKFYINLGPAPGMDGQYTVFGKVTRGLDVARKILTLPVRSDAEYPEGDRPVKPVVIRKVTILTDPTELARAN
jgi:cyclophilin family peptidyl-prolyl cis-trans isomerase